MGQPSLYRRKTYEEYHFRKQYFRKFYFKQNIISQKKIMWKIKQLKKRYICKENDRDICYFLKPIKKIIKQKNCGSVFEYNISHYIGFLPVRNISPFSITHLDNQKNARNGKTRRKRKREYFLPDLGHPRKFQRRFQF